MGLLQQQKVNFINATVPFFCLTVSDFLTFFHQSFELLVLIVIGLHGSFSAFTIRKYLLNNIIKGIYFQKSKNK